MRIHLPGNNFLQGYDNMCTDTDRIHTVLRKCAVAAFSLYGDMQFVIGKHHGRTVVVHEHTDGELAGAYVISQSGIDFGILQNTVLQHVQTARQTFLGRLEHQLDGSL